MDDFSELVGQKVVDVVSNALPMIRGADDLIKWVTKGGNILMEYNPKNGRIILWNMNELGANQPVGTLEIDADGKRLNFSPDLPLVSN